VKLDVVVPTYNRSHLLRRTVSSVLQAPISDGLDVTVLVVDNNSKDYSEQAAHKIQYIGAPCLPNCPVPLQTWLPLRYGRVLDIIYPKAPHSVAGIKSNAVENLRAKLRKGFNNHSR
jgi:glycosyltransferase involved in cell wall biosynthesis